MKDTLIMAALVGSGGFFGWWATTMMFLARTRSRYNQAGVMLRKATERLENAAGQQREVLRLLDRLTEQRALLASAAERLSGPGRDAADAGQDLRVVRYGPDPSLWLYAGDVLAFEMLAGDGSNTYADETQIVFPSGREISGAEMTRIVEAWRGGKKSGPLAPLYDEKDPLSQRERVAKETAARRSLAEQQREKRAEKTRKAARKKPVVSRGPRPSRSGPDPLDPWGYGTAYAFGADGYPADCDTTRSRDDDTSSPARDAVTESSSSSYDSGSSSGSYDSGSSSSSSDSGSSSY